MTERRTLAWYRKQAPKPIKPRGSSLIKPDSEDAYQAEVMKWAKEAEAICPQLALLFAIPNAGGYRSKAIRAVLWLTGVKSGVPDLCLPVARQGYHGLYIELKTAKGTVRPEQKRWLAALAAEGYRTEVCRSPQEAISLLIEYLGL